MARRTYSTIWPRPEMWGERAKRTPYRRRLLNWECDQQIWRPHSAGIIGGRRVRGPADYWRPKSDRGAPTVSVALLRQRVAYRAARKAALET